ncbi:hypothetical protein [Actinomadura rubrisoli]|uniref:Uncharacterized protein n=1 Tax=Actinomadura rubrisoli TaxID=2530368 RepID=A0A4R4ZTM3_9ACTN|nr:hypothetical protein [Actinomadura rubrisoli]TDD62433.1 hypothetical protein E1298_44660 [Actinomadura rubrisoli]
MRRPSKIVKERTGRRLKERRRAIDLTAKRVARYFKENAPRHLACRTAKIDDIIRTIRSHEAGEHYPGPDYQELWAGALNTTVKDLFAPALDAITPDAKGESIDNGLTLGGNPTISDYEVLEMRRRAALQVVTAAAAGTAIPPGALEIVLSGIHEALGDPLDVAAWEAVVLENGETLMTRPPGAMVEGLTADIFAVGEILRRPLAHADRSDLLRVAAGLSGLLAIDLGDSGDDRSARVAWDTACGAADASGDLELRVWVRGRAAQDSAWAGRPPHVVLALATEAVEIAGDTRARGAANA